MFLFLFMPNQNLSFINIQGISVTVNIKQACLNKSRKIMRTKDEELNQKVSMIRSSCYSLVPLLVCVCALLIL